MGLLEKFDKVEVKVESRISDYDCQFCQAHQTAYEKAREAMKKLADDVAKAQAEQYKLLKPFHDSGDCSFIGSSYRHEFKEDEILKELDNTHGCFIARLVNYFAHRYNVSLSDDAICKNLIPQKPEEPSGYDMFGWRSEWTDEMKAEFERRHEAYMIEKNAYMKKLRSLTLQYSDIVDQIFIQLGGCSFQEKAVQELKEAAHKYVWNAYYGKKDYEIKKNVITFSSSCSTYSWGRGEMQLCDGMKDVIRALAYFEYGTQDYMGAGFTELCGYTFYGNSFEYNWEKVKQIRCFKNGRVDIKFTSEKFAQQFAEDFLGTVAA